MVGRSTLEYVLGLHRRTSDSADPNRAAAFLQVFGVLSGRFHAGYLYTTWVYAGSGSEAQHSACGSKAPHAD